MPKRKWESVDHSDDDEPLLGRQILPVANLPDDFNQAPVDGMQYLFTVRYCVLVFHPALLLSFSTEFFWHADVMRGDCPM
jgi:hypothetical protein